jgi:hypothetical protein
MIDKRQLKKYEGDKLKRGKTRQNSERKETGTGKGGWIKIRVWKKKGGGGSWFKPFI